MSKEYERIRAEVKKQYQAKIEKLQEEKRLYETEWRKEHEKRLEVENELKRIQYEQNKQDHMFGDTLKQFMNISGILRDGGLL